jgi:putative membrane protein
MRNKLLRQIGAALVLLGSVAMASAADKASQKFITEAVQGNLAEVQVGKLAQEKGQSEGVRTFGQTLASDHSAANEKATQVAQQLGVTAPSEPNAKQKATYAKLSKLSGDAFDRAFAKEMVADHKKDIKEYQNEARKKNDPAAQYAQETLPVLQKHLGMAQKLRADTSGGQARSR